MRLTIHFIALFAVLVTFTCAAQESTETSKKSYVQPGLLSASATLSPTFMLNRTQVNYYLMGFLEGRVDKHLSLRGDINYLLPNDTAKFYKNNVRVCFGMQYGLPFGNFELHGGFMPGVAVSESNFNRGKWEVNPTLQLNIGVRYYVWKYFHFFANFSYFRQSLNNLKGINGMADEFMVSAGLGFNLQVLKKYR